jgi:lactate permease
MTFHQVLDPLHSIAGDTLLALVPVAVLLVLLGVFRMSAWRAVIVGSVVTLILAITAWKTPAGSAFAAYGLGAATGVWSIDWIVLWGAAIYNTMVVTGAFDDLKRWLLRQATADVRVQTLLMAWAFGALMEGLVGFGYPWAVVAPILIGVGVADLAALRVSALANNAPCSFGSLGTPIIGLAAVTGLPLLSLSRSIGEIVAFLALFPPWVLIYLVSGKRGLRDGWPLAVVASLAYIAGQLPTAAFLGPYLPDIFGALLCFAALLLLPSVWRPKTVLGFGGRELDAAEIAAAAEPVAGAGAGSGGGPGAMRATPTTSARHAVRGLTPFLIMVAVVTAWTGPWSSLPKYIPYEPAVKAIGSLSHKTTSVSWSFEPWVAGTAILVCWILTVAFLRPSPAQLRQAFRTIGRQMWGAFLVGPIVFGLADVFNYSGMASSMAHGFSRAGTAFVVLAPIIGWIGIALSGSNTSTNAVFGGFQLSVAKILGAPLLLFPSLNSVGAEVGKAIASQTASVGVSTSKYVRREGTVIRFNLPGSLAYLIVVIAIGCMYFFWLPGAMRP